MEEDSYRQERIEPRRGSIRPPVLFESPQARLKRQPQVRDRLEKFLWKPLSEETAAAQARFPTVGMEEGKDGIAQKR